MNERAPTKADLLAAWREAVRAAELAERLAAAATEASEQAGFRATISAELAELAERAAESAQRAAERARAVATEARDVATRLRNAVPDAEGTAEAARELESEAKTAYNRGPQGADEP
jgi:methyl-accepting chemotaxis protein